MLAEVQLQMELFVPVFVCVLMEQSTSKLGGILAG